VERTGAAGHANQLLIRLDEPAPGIAHLFAADMCGQVFVSVRVYLYGERAAAERGRVEPAWQAWFTDRFPPADGSAGAG
jgi:hypothetical protein